MKTLLQINVVVNSGSTGRITEEIGQTAMEQGWKNVIAFGRNQRPSQSELIKIGKEWDIRVHGLQTRLFDRHGLASKTATKKLVQQIQKINPDIIHLHNIHGYYLNIEILFRFLKQANIPVVWTLHDCWPITGHCVYFDYVGCEKWRRQCSRCPQKTSYPASYFIDRSNKNFKLKKELFSLVPNLTLVPVSNWLANILKESFLKNTPVKVIHNGINTEIFRPVSNQVIRTKYNVKGKFILLGVASDWSPRKGLKDFIELRKKLDSSYIIILVGLSKKQIKNLPNKIIGIEKTNNIQQLAELYSASDVFLNPTYEDNFPTTNLESMACGTPVITYKTGGSPESIDQNTGMIVKKGDINGLILAINQIKEKGKVFYTGTCVTRVHQLYKKEDRYQEYLTLYNSILK
ncbi:glycosyltransferase family 4 protein [Draconibacterium orientale]|uniref:glycosyltransferase family 4 protein n=1 Tax=Draconibacterium orientale TaxID=1168034 RepID=UPI002A0A4288|nr:glycosyltransferase family 4 protein [Draconibacterium orientale]